MKKGFTVISLFFLLSGANAQDCSKESIMQVKGKWSMLANNVVNPEKTFPASQYNQLYTRLDKIAIMFQQAYPQPAGIEAEWYRSIRGAAIVKNGPVPYQFNSLYLAWYCNQNLHKMILGSETGAWSYVYANNFGWLMTDQYDQADVLIDGLQAWLMPPVKGTWKGLTLYEPTASSKGNSAVLITRNDQFPYKPVTRLQFLQSMKTKFEKDMNLQIEAIKKQPVRSPAEEDAARQHGLENAIKNVPPDRVAQRSADYLKHYQTAQQRKDENISQAASFFNTRLKPLNDELNTESSAALQQAAIVNSDYNSIFKGFTTQDKGGRMIVLINNDYFNKTLPRYVPQFIVLYWSWDKSAPSQRFKEAFEENFPVAQLKAMIDK